MTNTNCNGTSATTNTDPDGQLDRRWRNQSENPTQTNKGDGHVISLVA